MKKYIRCLAAVLLPNLLLITATQAQNLEQVRRLLATNECAGCSLSFAELSHAELSQANLEAANLKSANLMGANLEGANLEGANLEEANLVRANLEGANLEGANLKDAALCFATMSSGLSPCIRDVLPPPERVLPSVVQ